MTTAKMIGALRITSGTSLWITEVDGLPVTAIEVALTAGLYYVSGDDSASDLLYHIEQRVLAESTENLSFNVDASGIVSHRTTVPTTSLTISWALPSGETGGSAVYLQEWLRLEGFGDEYTVSAAFSSGARTHAYGYYPTYYLQTDLERYEPRASQLVPDNGDAQNIKIARRKKYKLKVRSFGFPRESGFNEYHALEDWHDHAISGRPFRLYADTDTTTAVYSTSNRYGYQTMTLEPDAFEPAPLAGNWYKHMTWEFVAHEYTG